MLIDELEAVKKIVAAGMLKKTGKSNYYYFYFNIAYLTQRQNDAIKQDNFVLKAYPSSR